MTVAVVTILILAILTPLAYMAISSYAAEKRMQEEFAELIKDPKTFYPGSSLNGEDISGLTPEEVINEFESDFDESYVTIKSTRTNESEEFYFSSINADFDNFESYVMDSFESQSYTLEEFSGDAETKRRDYEYDINNDVSFNNADFSGISFIDATKVPAPTDAYVHVDVYTGETDIVDETEGALAVRSILIGKIMDAVMTGSSSVTIEEADYVTPEIRSDDASLVDAENYYQTVLNKTLQVYVCGLSETLTSDEIRDFLVFKDTELRVDLEALGVYVDALKENYDSYNKLYQFHTSLGTDVTLDYGNYGWLIDKGNTVERLANAILENSPETIARCAYTYTCSRPTNALQGNSYLEISLEHQKVWLYIDGALVVHDDCTTGEISGGQINTYPGFFHVKNKKTETILKGPTWEDFVHYWILYDEAHADGIHDATWREEWEFGGQNRNGNGSHGCVNLRLETAAIIYEKLTEDMPVIIW